MIAYKKERLENAICYFAAEHERRAGSPAYMTFILKYLALFDFSTLEKIGKPALELKWDALPFGPVTFTIYNQKKPKILSDCFEQIKTAGKSEQFFRAVSAPDLDYFSEVEIDIMNRLLDEFAHPGAGTDDIVGAAHERIAAYKKAWGRRTGKKEPIYYSDAFDDLSQKSEEELTPQEEAFLIYQGLEEARE